MCIYCAVVITAVTALPALSFAHGFAGKRFFPTTFTVDDPFISDEFSLLFNTIKQPGADNNPPARLTGISVDYSKRLLPHFGLTLSEGYQHLGASGASGPANGFTNLEAGLKWQFLTSGKHEAILSLGTSIEIGGTGARQVSDSFSRISPAFFFGKGFGELPEAMRYLRPLAVTGVAGLSFPTRSKNVKGDSATGDTGIERNPTVLNWGLSVQYSLMYLQSFVKDIGLGKPLKRMIFVTEFPMQTNLTRDGKGQTTGTVNPGVVWAGKTMELGIAAQIPINSQSGHGVGVLGLIHFFIDDLFPKSLGRPVFGK
ncbi:MAG TPA: hypothetical protein VF790_13910 [Dissulfurispiraceae bacterium]